MDIQENERSSRRSSVVSGSLAYYNLLAGINVARVSAQMQRISPDVSKTSNKSEKNEAANN
ncbi:MAG: hypothetical protein ACKOW6_03785 [Fluviibacter sp.]